MLLDYLGAVESASVISTVVFVSSSICEFNLEITHLCVLGRSPLSVLESEQSHSKAMCNRVFNVRQKAIPGLMMFTHGT